MTEALQVRGWELTTYVAWLESENESLRDLLMEWVANGRFLTSNSEEKLDLIKRSKEIIGTLEEA
jgi:hypothetical protein